MSTATDAQRVTSTNSDARAVDPRTVRPASLPIHRLNLMRAGWRRYVRAPGDPRRGIVRTDPEGRAA